MTSELRTKWLNTNAVITLNLKTETAINPIPSLFFFLVIYNLDF